MKISQIKPGNTVSVYCSGKLVEATVTSITDKEITTEHEPVRWGPFTFRETSCSVVDYDDYLIPHCFIDGEQITR